MKSFKYVKLLLTHLTYLKWALGVKIPAVQESKRQGNVLDGGHYTRRTT